MNDNPNIVGIRTGGVLTTMAALATTYTLWATTPGRRAILRKIMWYAPLAAANGTLLLGILNVAAAFVQLFPTIDIIAGATDGFTELDLPIFGNYREGFMADTTALTGTLGYISAQCTCPGIAANNVQVIVEVEEIGS